MSYDKKVVELFDKFSFSIQKIWERKILLWETIPLHIFLGEEKNWKITNNKY